MGESTIWTCALTEIDAVNLQIIRKTVHSTFQKVNFHPFVDWSRGVTCPYEAHLFSFFIFLCLTTSAQKKKITQTKLTLTQADSLFVAGNFKDAITAYNVALKDPTTAKDIRAWHRLGASWFNPGDYTKALPPFERAWTLNSKQPGLRLGLTGTYSMLNKNGKAIAMLDSTHCRWLREL